MVDVCPCGAGCRGGGGDGGDCGWGWMGCGVLVCVVWWVGLVGGGGGGGGCVWGEGWEGRGEDDGGGIVRWPHYIDQAPVDPVQCWNKQQSDAKR